MRLVLVLALSLLLFFAPVAGHAADAATACTQPPHSALFNGLKAVGLAMDIRGADNMVSPLSREHLVKLFAARIRKEILPFLVPDKNCRVQDLVIFREYAPGHPYDHLALPLFIERPDTLTIKVSVDYYPPYSLPREKKAASGMLSLYWHLLSNRRKACEPGSGAEVTFNYFRPSVMHSEELWDTLNTGYRVYIPLDLPRKEIETKLAYLVSRIYFQPDRLGPIGQVQRSARFAEEIEKHEPPAVVVPRPPVAPYEAGQPGDGAEY